MPRICDYEGSQYRTDFWEGQNRAYEDRVERVAMQALLPRSGRRIIEVGAGFGRLADLYAGYDEIILTDYARTQLEQAQDYLNHDDRFTFVVADIYNMPFVDHLCDALTMVRVMHHLTDVPAALGELNRIIAPQGTAVIEYASKRHLKSLLRWLVGRQKWSPFDRTPLEFVDLNFDFHPGWMQDHFKAAGFEITNIRALSYFRLGLLKKMVPTEWLVALDGVMQPTGRWLQLSPSIFLRATAQKPAQPPPTNFFRCPLCHQTNFSRQKLTGSVPTDEILICPAGHGWSFKNGIYDFKNPLRLA